MTRFALVHDRRPALDTPRWQRRWRTVQERWRARFDGSRWLIRPPPVADRRVCILASYAADGHLSALAIDLARTWQAAGYLTILCVACADPGRFEIDPAVRGVVAGLLVRRNVGYDFGSWSAGIRRIRGLARATILALANDSVFGPLTGFDDLLRRVGECASDIVAMTDSFEITHHVQSYLVFYKPRALCNIAFRQFWRRLRGGDRHQVILDSELPFLEHMRSHGLATDVMFPSPTSPVANPTLWRWRELIEAGFPFVKVQLLRENPFAADLHDWRRVLEDRGYAPARVRAHFGDRYDVSAAALASPAERSVGVGVPAFVPARSPTDRGADRCAAAESPANRPRST